MADINSLTTFSGLLVFFGVLALLYRRTSIAAVLMIIAGAGGTAMAWDRWSLRTGHHVQVQALFDGAPLHSSELMLLITHIPLLIIGVVLLLKIHRNQAL